MKIGIVADVHCNHEGLLAALERMGPVDELLCAGDAVYQFRFSNEVMELLRDHGARYVLGNHERVILGPWGERARSLPTVRRGNLEFMAGKLKLERGRIPCDRATHTALQGFFAGGDVATGAGTVAAAVGSGKRSALAIDCYLRGESLDEFNMELLEHVNASGDVFLSHTKLDDGSDFVK